MSKNRNRAFSKLNQINNQLDDIFAQLYELEPSQLNIKPNENTWSVIQILNHLYDTEWYNLKYLNFKLQEGANWSKESLKSRIKMYTYFIALASPFKFKAPKAVAHPSNKEDFERMREKFASLRAETQQLMENQDDQFFTLGSCKHPLIGRLTMRNMLRFFSVHTNHHRKQIYRTLISLGNRS